MSSAIALLRIRGLEVRAHWTWIFLLALITVVFGGGLAAHPETPFEPAWAWGAGAAAAVLVFVSVAAHEVAHAAVARRNGIGGSVVVVQLLGGMYVMETRPRTAGQEFRSATAGPAVSLLLAAATAGLFAVLELAWGASDSVPQAVLAASFVAEVLAMFNVFLAVVNLVPGYPMDGARIVHAIAWAASKREDVANTAAGRVGRVVGGAIIVLGALAVPLIDWWPGLGLMLAGWMILGSSRLLDRRASLQGLLANSRAGDALAADTQRIPAQLTLDIFAAEYLRERAGDAAVVERGGDPVGIVGTMQIRRVSARKWATMRTEEAMVAIERVPRVAADSDLWSAVEVLERSGLDAVLVDGGEDGPGLLTRRSAASHVHELAEARARQASEPSAGDA
jgi:Zn-dependent protease/CBS domain-containing protein